ncbi:MAG TPA: hypothetical protein VII75_13425 [Thermoanaerobaculia bacterium]|nr:hypothetical protein [Thermoanaerobaculia bacterium]
MRPSVAEERAHAILDQLDDWTLASEERSAFGKRLATQWRRNSVFVAAAFFGLTVFAMFALIALCKSIGATEFAAAAIAIAGAEVLIRRKRMFGSGIESALFIGGLIAFIGGLPSGNTKDAMLVFAAAFALAAWRMQNAIFGTIGAIFVALYFSENWQAHHDYWRVAMVPLALTIVAIVAKRWIGQRPWIDAFWSYVAIVMPLVAEVLGQFATYDSHGRIERVVLYVVLALIAIVAGLHLRDHALLIAAAVCIAIAAFEAHDLTELALEWKLIAGGVSLLAISGLLSRALRGRTTGFVATPAQLTRFDELIKLGAAMAAQPEKHAHAETTNPDMAGTDGGSGSFGGAGASGEY